MLFSAICLIYLIMIDNIINVIVECIEYYNLAINMYLHIFFNLFLLLEIKILKKNFLKNCVLVSFSLVVFRIS